MEIQKKKRSNVLLKYFAENNIEFRDILKAISKNTNKYVNTNVLLKKNNFNFESYFL